MQFRVKDLAERAIAYGIPRRDRRRTDACQVYDACTSLRASAARGRAGR